MKTTTYPIEDAFERICTRLEAKKMCSELNNDEECILHDAADALNAMRQNEQLEYIAKRDAHNLAASAGNLRETAPPPPDTPDAELLRRLYAALISTGWTPPGHPQIPDAPEGYRYELIRLSTPDEPTPRGPTPHGSSGSPDYPALEQEFLGNAPYK